MADPVYLSITELPGTGAAAPTVVDFNFAGGYINRSHIKAYILDTTTFARTDVTVLAEHFVTDWRLQLPVSVPVGSVLRVYRDTPKDAPLVDFTNGARIAENNLDLVAQQAVFAAAESADQIAATQVADVLQAVEAAALSATAAQAGATAAQAGAAASAVSAEASQAAAQEGASIAGGFATAAAASATAAAAEASAVRADLASPASGKGAALIGKEGGGTVQEAIDSISAKPSNALTSPSYRLGLNYSQIDPSVISAWTFDGASGFPNKLGINNTNPVSGTWTPDTGYVANGAAYSAILGGYDNVANGLASMVASMHSMVYSAADHGAIYGGSLHAIEKGSYSSIYGGTNNRVTALRNDGVTASLGTNAHVMGGRDNRATSANATIVGGQSQIVDGEYASAIGGSTNRALGNFDHVAGSNNETRRGTLGAGQRNTIGGGRFNIIDSVTNPQSNTISGGEDHEIYGSFNTVGGGDNSTIGQAGTNSAYGVIAGGLDNTVTAGNAGTVAGGRSNSVTADYGTVIGGRENTTSGQYAAAGGYQAVARHDYGISYGASRFAANGDAQFSTVARKATTTDATPTAMQTIALPDDSTYVFSVLIVARRTDADNESGGYKIEGVIDRNSGAGTTALVGTPVVTTIAEDTAAFNATVAANAGSGGLAISVTGEAGKTIRWVAKVDLVEVTG